MQPFTQTASTRRLTPAGGFRAPRQTAEIVYQGMTIAAMLLLLGSLWAL